MAEENATTTFQDSLPEDLRGHESLKDFKDVGGLAKSFIDTQAMVGNSVRIPGENASDEDVAKFYTSLGRPETPDGYELSTWEQPQGFKANEDMTSSFKTVGHQLGLTGKQMEGLNNWYGEQINGMATNMQTDRDNRAKTVMAEFRKELGASADAKIDLASAAMNKFASKEIIEYLDETGLGNDPMLLRLFMGVADNMGEDQILNGNVNNSMQLTPALAKEEIAKLQRDADFMRQYNTAGDPGHEDAKKKMTDLFQLAYPE